MKITNLAIAVTCIFLYSCQSEENKMLAMLKEAHNSLEYKQKYENTGGNGSYGILKSDDLLQVLSRDDKMTREIYDEKKRKIDFLVFNEIVEFSLLDDRTFTNKYGERVNVQKYSLSLTEKGRKYLLGETSNKFIFKIYDLDDFRLSGKPTISNDTIFINYTVNKIKKTEVYDCLDKLFLKNPNTSVLLSTQSTDNYKLTAKFLKSNGRLELVDF